MAQRFPEDFIGAAPEGVDIICLSSDEEEGMCDLSMTSVLDLQLSSEDEGEIDDEIMMMAQCVEMELSSPIPVPGPSTALKIRNEAPRYNPPRYGTSGASFATRPTLDQSFFSLGKGNGPIQRDDRARNNHPIKLCREIIPMVDTPMSPHQKRKDQLTTPIQRTVRARLPSSHWTQLQTISKEWRLRQAILWQITQIA